MDIITAFLCFAILILLWFTLNYYSSPEVYTRKIKKGHSFKKTKKYGVYCNFCEILLSASGLVCEYCGVAADKLECMKIADQKLKCKEKRVAIKSQTTDQYNFKHQFFKGNLISSICKVCNQEIENFNEPGIIARRCCWCQESFHDDCVEELCDFGKFQEFILPPFSVKASRTKLDITPIPKWANWKPLTVIANDKSGSSDANILSSLFRGVLNPIQVISLSAFKGPKEALQLAIKMCPVQSRLLVCGGDGSVAWLLNTIHDLKIEPMPQVAICPIGTGNDLSRVLGWGSEVNDEELHSPMNLIENLKNAQPVQLDRWLMEIKYENKSIISRSLHHDRKQFMYNYFSVGVDALVTLNFHKARESAFYIVKSKIVNKFMYFLYGTQQVLTQDCSNLENNIEVYLDNVKLDLPELQSVVVLNIDSWGAGVRLVEMSKESDSQFAESHSISDGLVEVFGVVSSFHIAQLQVGLSTPIKLGQAKEVRIKFKTVCPVQADGEPWYQTPCEITITKHSQATMLKCVT